MTLILVATFVFQPIRNWIQERLDRYYFYKDRYDYRRTLVEFARELSSETDLGLHARTRWRAADARRSPSGTWRSSCGRTSGRFQLAQVDGPTRTSRTQLISI